MQARRLAKRPSVGSRRLGSCGPPKAESGWRPARREGSAAAVEEEDEDEDAAVVEVDEEEEDEEGGGGGAASGSPPLRGKGPKVRPGRRRRGPGPGLGLRGRLGTARPLLNKSRTKRPGPRGAPPGGSRSGCRGPVGTAVAGKG